MWVYPIVFQAIFGVRGRGVTVTVWSPLRDRDVVDLDVFGRKPGSTHGLAWAQGGAGLQLTRP